MGGQEQFADRQGQLFGGQGLYFGWAGVVMLRNHKFGQFHVVQNLALRTNQPSNIPTKGHILL